MRVLVTGHQGYLGSVLTTALAERGHQVSGLDIGYYGGPATPAVPVPALALDVRDVTERELRGYDAVIHLAGISNDPMSELHPAATWQINHAATVRLAELARAAGVSRLLFASTCSVYGEAGQGIEVDELTETNPLTPYAQSKLLAEQDLMRLAGPGFAPTALRMATLYGGSPMLRTDLVVNNLVAAGLATGEISLRSDGVSWRPLVHVRDAALAFVTALDAAPDRVSGQVVNVGPNNGNHRVAEIAEFVAAAIPGTRVSRPAAAPADRRSYRVSFTKLNRLLPALPPCRDLQAGIARLVAGLRDRQPPPRDWFDAGHVRILRLRQLVASGVLTDELRYQSERDR